MEVPEPACPLGMVPHRQRIANIIEYSPIDKIAGVCIDNKPEYINYYLQELRKHKAITIIYKGEMTPDVYLIKIRKMLVN